MANDPMEKHSSFALSPSSHTARHDFKGGVADDYREHYHGGDNDLVSLCLADNEKEKDSSVKIISGKREMNGYYCTLPRNLSHRYVFFSNFEPCHDTYSVLFYKRS